jgi:hypothetical protein
VAIIHELRNQPLERDVEHSEAAATYTVISAPDGGIYLQIDTYGSSNREMPGKKSQSIRFSPKAIIELKQILAGL